MSDFFKARGFDFHIERVTVEQARSLGPHAYGQTELEQLVYKLDGGSHQYLDDTQLELTPGTVMLIPSTTKSHRDDIYDLGSTIIVCFRIYDREKYDFAPASLHIGEEPRFLKLEAAHHLGQHFRCQSLFSEILDRVTRFSEPKYLDGKKYAILSPAIDYIGENCLMKPITTEELCALCGVSGSYLRQLFHRFTGKTPVDYINTLRLENARELLLSGKYSVTEAAMSSGFESPGYFSRLFTRKYGYAPKTVKK